MKEIEIIDELKTRQFDHVISLGFFCSVAQDLEMMGLRDASGPVDWVWSTWRGIKHCIETGFQDFMLFDNIQQSDADNCIYADRLNGIVSFHDFSRYKSFEKQYQTVRDKYQRRISKFYREIESPTLFIRYIWNGEYDGEYSNEIRIIEEDYLSFLAYIKKFNEANEIIFVANNDISSDILPVFYVMKDENDDVNRHPLFGNAYLREYLENMNYPSRISNLQKYKKKIKKKNNPFYRALGKCVELFQNHFRKKYIYGKIYNHEVYKCG